MINVVAKTLRFVNFLWMLRELHSYCMKYRHAVMYVQDTQYTCPQYIHITNNSGPEI